MKKNLKFLNILIPGEDLFVPAAIYYPMNSTTILSPTFIK